MNKKCGIFWQTAFTLALLRNACAQVPDQDTGEVMDAWARRQASVRSVVVQWSEEKWRLALETDPRASGLKQPPEVEKAYRKTLMINGTMIRYEFVETPGDRHFQGAYNGRVSKTLHSPSGSRNYPSGFLYEKANPDELYVMHNKAVLLAFRPLEPVMNGFRATQLRATGRRAFADDHDCLVLVDASRPSNAPDLELWVAPGLDFSVIKTRYTVDDKIRREIDIKYELQEPCGFVPSQWTVSQYGDDGQMILAARATVTACEVNKPLTEHEFDIDFPVGTWVTDVRASRAVDFIVLASGEKRLIRPEELRNGATYEQLMEQSATKTSGIPKLTWVAALIAAIGVAGLAGFLLRRRPSGNTG